MPFDSPTRNKLQKMVASCRRILTEEFTSQLQGLYGVQPTGEITSLASMSHLDDEQHTVASLLRERIDHLAGGLTTDKKKAKEAIDRVIREQAFTVLNRLAALRMCEERGIAQECIRGGFQSRGFQVYCTTVGASLGGIYERYRVFLQCVFNEISVDLGILFDRFSPLGLLFPREAALVEVLKVLNDAELTDICKDDETIGWIYQYFNSKEEREAMRRASAAPRNSRELAVRNQFFTPRYVVEFLTDNTLGRIWYEMRQGVTALKDDCRYLVKRPDEVFLSAPSLDFDALKNTPHYPIQWLLEGSAETFPVFDLSEASRKRLIDLAHCVSGYPRHPFEDEVDGKWWPFWVKEQIEKGKPLTDFSTQELFDTLFGLVRADRHSSPYSTLLEEPPTLSIANELRRRAIESRREDLSQEALIKQPVFIPLREKKDPRDIRVLDPACGSGHFLLYAFDLLETIYTEAWAGAGSPESEVTGKTLREDFPDLETLKRDVPRLIIEHNLHGIDIDPRAVQIAGLSLWLRAQRSCQNLGLKPGERPRITRANVICAEPMPGEKNLLEEFISSFRGEQCIVGELVREVWEKMQLAGEAGSLLRIEVELREAIERARKEWEDVRRGQPVGQLPMWPDRQPSRQLEIRMALGEIKKEAFWDQAEDWVLEALKHFAEKAGNGKAYQRKLFAEDAAQGFAFIDMCQKKYDVVLMNPPFGLAPRNVFDIHKKAYADSYVELYAQMVVRGSQTLTENGHLGAISSRSFMTISRLRQFRYKSILTEISLLVDLGSSVMDDAFVESAAYILSKHSNNQLMGIDLRAFQEPQTKLVESIVALKDQNRPTNWVIKSCELMASLPDGKLLYALPIRVHRLLDNQCILEPDVATVRQGMGTFNDFRFLRLRQEVSIVEIQRNGWEPLAKGGAFSFYYSDIHLLLNWKGDGAELSAVNIAHNGQDAQVRQASEYWRRAGSTYSKRSQKGFSARALPADCIIAGKGPAILSQSEISAPYLLGWVNSRFIRWIIEMQANDHEYNTGIVKRIPWIQPSQTGHQLAKKTSSVVCKLQHAKSIDETNSCFCPILDAGSLRVTLEKWNAINRNAQIGLSNAMADWDRYIDELYGVDSREFQLNDSEEHESQEQDEDEQENASLIDGNDSTNNALGIIIGITLGRLDVRIAMDSSLAPELPDPFDPLPACAPGMLVGPDGLPAKPNGIASEEWLRARPNAITLPPEGSVSRPTIRDEDYPLRITWSGILVDELDGDEAHAHLDDVVHRVREVLDLLWGDRAHTIEQEACEILGVTILREYFRKPSGFFDDHLKRYSKSRRKAPIYWPLSTESGSYTLWIYYHRLTDQTLYHCVMDFVDPKLEMVGQDVDRLHGQILKGGTAKQRDQLERLQKLQQELADFREELLRVAALPYRPNLNDGVIISASPLHKLFRLPRWRKDLEECWKKLESGEYDWAHLAYSIWPDRVREKCRKDKSIAIAHGLEELYEEIPAPKKTKRGKKSV